MYEVFHFFNSLLCCLVSPFIFFNFLVDYLMKLMYVCVCIDRYFLAMILMFIIFCSPLFGIDKTLRIYEKKFSFGLFVVGGD